MKKEAGFSLLEILIVIALMGIIASMAVRNLVQSRKAANEMMMIGTLRTVGGSQVTYQGIHQLYGTLPALEAMGPIDQTIVDAMGASSVGKSGYWFSEEVPTPTSFAIMVAPQTTRSGDRCYGAFEDGVIYVKSAPTDYVTDLAKVRRLVRQHLEAKFIKYGEHARLFTSQTSQLIPRAKSPAVS